jgi:hypothetical protein
MMQTARQDNYTGAIPNEGSPQWGAGKINAYAAVQLAVQTLGFLDTKPQIEWSVYPNPVQHYLYFTIVELPPFAEVIALDGTRYWVAIENSKMSVQELPTGTYYIRLHQNGRIQQAPFIKI